MPGYIPKLLLIMKLTTFILMMSLLQVSAATFGQKVTLKQDNITIDQVFREIRKQTSYDVLMNITRFRSAKINVNFKNTPLKEVLDELVKGQNLEYTIKEKTVVVREKNLQIMNKEEKITISGQVVDEEGKVVERASVTFKGSNIGAIADDLGNFTITFPAKSNNILVFSSLGYAPQEYKAVKSAIITIVLTRQAKQGDEVVVVGLGTQQRKFLTTSVATVTAKEMENLPMTNIYEVLNGRVPGLVVRRDYSPGGGKDRLEIRGQSTAFQMAGADNSGKGAGLSANDFGFGNSQPLVLIDGFEGDMSSINPQDVETVSVLKDASAAIYGIRAANGVILITTKKGLENSFKVSYDYNIGLQSFNRRPTYLPSWQQATLVNEAIANEGGGGGIGGGGIGGVNIGGGGGGLTAYTPAEIQKFKDGTDPAYPNTKWEDLFFKRFPLQQRHNLSFSGGDKRSKYALSFEALNQRGSLPNAFTNRYNVRFNLNTKITDKMVFNGGLSFSSKPVESPVVGVSGFGSGDSNSDLLTYLTTFSPTLPLRWANGAYSNNGRAMNPAAWAETDSKTKSNFVNTTGNFGLSWKPLKGLSINPSGSFSYGTKDNKLFVDKLIAYSNTPAGSPLLQDFNASRPQNSLYNGTNKNYVLNGQVTANYNRIFGNHEIDIMAGGLRSYAYASNFSGQVYNLLNSSIQTIDMAPTANSYFNGSEIEGVQQSVFGRLRYNYNDIVVLESTLRSDGNTAFAPGNRYKIFPAFSGAWLISSHDFFKNSSILKAINFLKIRASWGVLGNSSVGYYTYLLRLNKGNYVLNGQPGLSVAPNTGFNEDIQWEKTRIADIGLDARLLKNKLSLTFDWYDKQTNGLITTGDAVPANYGLPAAPENVGSISNKGMELQANYNSTIGSVSWSIGGNIAYNKAKMLKYVNKEIGKGLAIVSSFVEGQDPYAIYGLKSNGIYQSQQEVTGSPVLNPTVGPGDIRYIDINHDGKIDGDDRVKLGTSRAPLQYGFTLGTNWKGFGLQAYFRGAIGQSSVMSQALGGIGNSDNKVVSDYWDRWTPENHSTTFPRAWSQYAQNNPNSTISDFWLRKADYLKLDNLTFSYNLPQKVCRKMYVNSIRVFYSGQNILTYAPDFWKWIDPETAGGVAASSYPSIKNHSFGISVGL
jgi:TonB-linked SusC/RagA family outer membrane protein